MDDILIFIGLIVGCIALLSGAYVIGRVFTKGALKELDMFLGKKFTDYINNKNKRKNDNEKEE